MARTSSRSRTFRYVPILARYERGRCADDCGGVQYTVNNKKIEIAVKQIVSGSTLKPSGTVANPDSLQLYYKYRHLESLPEVKSGQAKAKL